MGTLLNRRRYMGGAKGLPYDAEIEYLESTGTQYIDIGYDVGSTDEFSIRAARLSNNSTFAFGAYNSNSSVYTNLTIYHGSKHNVEFAWGTTGKAKNTTALPIDEFHTYSSVLESTTLHFEVDGNDIGNLTGVNNFVNLILFGRNSNTTPSLSSVRISFFKYWRSGVLVRDMIPVRVGQVGYLYDKVSGQLFGNAGTGDFVLGPDVVTIMTTETNPEVLAVCYAQGWCASPDKMTSLEAAAVTDIGTVFSFNTSITHFEELEYFGVTSYADNAFKGCTNLIKVKMSAATASFNGSLFMNCTNLTTYILLATTPPSGVGQWTFRYASKMYVYVPDDYVETYTADSAWRRWTGERIKGISELPT